MPTKSIAATAISLVRSCSCRSSDKGAPGPAGGASATTLAAGGATATGGSTSSEAAKAGAPPAASATVSAAAAREKARPAEAGGVRIGAQHRRAAAKASIVETLPYALARHRPRRPHPARRGFAALASGQGRSEGDAHVQGPVAREG